jgi:hypothetical protein
LVFLLADSLVAGTTRQASRRVLVVIDDARARYRVHRFDLLDLSAA